MLFSFSAAILPRFRTFRKLLRIFRQEAQGRMHGTTPARHIQKEHKTKIQRIFYAGFFGGRGWMSRAALLKTAHWAVFALSSATAPQLFESTRPMSLALLQNKNLSVLVYAEVFWWARVDSNKHHFRQPMRELTEFPVFKPIFVHSIFHVFQHAPNFSLLSGLRSGLLFPTRRILRQRLRYSQRRFICPPGNGMAVRSICIH